MEKTFEKFKEEVGDLINWYNESKFKTLGLFYKEIMATFHEGEFGYSAVLFYKWVRVEDGEAVEDFHRDPNYWRIKFDKTYNVWTATRNGDRHRLKNLSTIKKYMR